VTIVAALPLHIAATQLSSSSRATGLGLVPCTSVLLSVVKGLITGGRAAAAAAAAVGAAAAAADDAHGALCIVVNVGW
jgi:hypothetical protein